MKKHKKLVIGGAVILVALVALGFAGFNFMSAASYSYNVGEYLSKGPAVFEQSTRITGLVGDDLTKNGLNYQFTLKDMSGAESMVVKYTGSVPDTFATGRQVVVTGKYDQTAGVFQATGILAKCASKYQAE